MDQNILSLDAAPSWAIWVGDLGRGLVLFGAAAFVVALIAALLSKNKPGTAKLSSLSFVLGAISVLGAFVCLATLFAKNQFEYQYVFSHGDALTELKYKIAGVWSGQQGSFLLWACTSSIFGVLALRSTGIYRRWFVATYSLFLGSLCGILAYETPFGLLDGVQHAGKILLPQTGNGLTPSLENYWVVIHPPTIFTGFGSLTVLFCFAVSAMLTGNVKDWIHMVRPWALVSTAILGLGICMGGMWAYETLGWGGFWAWDPVENVSFVPWLFVVAFVHGIIVQTTKNRWISSNLFLGGLPFIAFVYGTFLTRSGYLSEASVHSFAEMQRSALLILLGFLGFCAIGFGILWFVRGRPASANNSERQDGFNRESIYRMSVTLLALLGLTITIGMSVPFFLALFGKPSKVVEESLYHMVVVWFFVPIMLLLAVGPFVSWRSMATREFWARVINVVSLSIGLTGLTVLAYKWPKYGVNPDPMATINLPFSRQNPHLPHEMPLMPWMAILTFLCVFALVANIWRVGEISRRSKVFSLGGFVAHIGVAVLMAGLVLSRGFERKEQVITQSGTPVLAMGYVLNPDKLDGDLFDRNSKLPVQIAEPGGEQYTAMPGLYWIHDANGNLQSMRWPWIRHSISHDVYLALGDPVTTVWPEPKLIKPQSSEPNQMFTLHYDGLQMIGKPGQVGTKFVAKMRLDENGKTYNIAPALTLTDQGLDQSLTDAGPMFYVSLMGMDAATKSASVQVFFKVPFYPMELFYKPFTSLVWLGAGILFIGGLMSAVYRRNKPIDPDSNTDLEPAVESSESKDDALVPAS